MDGSCFRPAGNQVGIPTVGMAVGILLTTFLVIGECDFSEPRVSVPSLRCELIMPSLAILWGVSCLRCQPRIQDASQSHQSTLVERYFVRVTHLPVLVLLGFPCWHLYQKALCLTSPSLLKQILKTINNFFKFLFGSWLQRYQRPTIDCCFGVHRKMVLFWGKLLTSLLGTNERGRGKG